MTVRFDTFFTDYTRHFADAASRANRLALESAESALDVQLRVFESNTTATASANDTAISSLRRTLESFTPCALRAVTAYSLDARLSIAPSFWSSFRMDSVRSGTLAGRDTTALLLITTTP